MERVFCFKLLGLWFKSNLSWDKNCKEIAKKAYAKINCIAKIKYLVSSIEDLLYYYNTYVCSQLQYCENAKIYPTWAKN